MLCNLYKLKLLHDNNCIGLLLPRETDGHGSGSQHSDEPGDRAAATLVSPRAAHTWRCSGRATWLDLQPGRGK